MDLYQALIQRLPTLYPATSREIDWARAISPTLICPVDVRLPQDLLERAKTIVEAFSTLQWHPDRSAELMKLSPRVFPAWNPSILMSYDFHVDTKGRLRLIEINTNASMSLLVDAMMDVRGTRTKFVEQIVDCFKLEYERATGSFDPKTVAIVDVHPEQQKLFVEFKMYEELFERRGWKVSIEDTSMLRVEGDRLVGARGPIDIVYNRDTDFYLEQPRVAALREAAERKLACITPNPQAYRMLADKERLIELCRPGVLESLKLTPEREMAIRETLIDSIVIDSDVDKEKLWSERKKWFFKPRRSFGSKAAYRGSSISRGVFDNVMNGNYVAQEYVPAGMIGEFKFDLRFYAYHDLVQLSCARLYQGQLTNSQTPGGGVAPITWI